MDKKYIIAIVAAVVVIAAGAFFVVGMIGNLSFSIGGDEFSNNLREVGNGAAEIATIQEELNSMVNDNSKNGTAKKIELANQYLDILSKEKTYLNKALDSTDNETRKEYIKLLIDLNQKQTSILKNELSMFKKWDEYDNGKISGSEYNNEYDKYMETFNKYNDESKNVCKSIKDLLKDNPEFTEELKSYGFSGIYIGDFF